MRHESTVTSLGWIPSEAIEGMMRLPIDIGGLRSSTVRARTPSRVAVQSTVTADPDTLAAIASGHRAEEV